MTNVMETFAGELYEKYCEAVGGKAFNGDPLPDWKTFRADPSKTKQSDAWVAVAQYAVGRAWNPISLEFGDLRDTKAE